MAAVPSNSSFIAAYPEYLGAPSADVTSALTRAARRTNADVFATDDLTADAVMLKAAILLLRSKFGYKLRQEQPNTVFGWEIELRQMQGAATMGLRVF